MCILSMHDSLLELETFHVDHFFFGFIQHRHNNDIIKKFIERSSIESLMNKKCNKYFK